MLFVYNVLVQSVQGEDICVAAVREVKEETGVSDLIALLMWVSPEFSYLIKCQ